jgi:hypothetical protein
MKEPIVLTPIQVEAINVFLLFKKELHKNASDLSNKEFTRLATERFEKEYPHHWAVLKSFQQDLLKLDSTAHHQ